MKYELLTRAQVLDQTSQKIAFMTEMLTEKMEKSLAYSEREENMTACKELDEYLTCLSIINDYLVQVEDEAEAIKLVAERMEG